MMWILHHRGVDFNFYYCFILLAVFIFFVTLNFLVFSSDEGEGKDELAEYFAMENGYNGELPSPVIPSSLLEGQVR